MMVQRVQYIDRQFTGQVQKLIDVLVGRYFLRRETK
jgi:hypothetical protein